MLKEMITMNDKALYQLERAAEALTLMAKYLREEQDTISFIGSVTGSGILGGQDEHSSYWFDYNRNDRNRTDPFNWHSGVIGTASPDTIIFS
jgi:hypothetical protein